ncbi:MAG: glycosyltransferase family 39 protein [Euryarchaeota archaeon]|nr:glycosyltransferase family 39 protein [Euryarchaeota archaeon]
MALPAAARSSWSWFWQRRDRVFAWSVPILFFVVGLFVYGHDLGSPEIKVFDEVHYLKASRAFSNGTLMNPDWGEPRPHNFEHPPLGKFWIALSIHFLGDEPSSWRLPAVIYGALGLAGMAVLGRRLFDSHWAGLFAPLLLLLDPMWFVHSRLALLEVYVSAPMIWAFAFALGEWRWDRWAAAVAAGIGLAGKFSAVFLLPALFILVFWRLVRHTSMMRAFAGGVLFAFGVPGLVYFVSHGPFLWEWAWQEGPLWALQHWAWLFKESLVWGAGGPQEHPEVTAPLYWIPMVRPTWYYVFWGDGKGLEQMVGLIYAIGNPVVWWGGLAFAFVVLTGPFLRTLTGLARADAVAGEGEEVVARFRADDRARWGSMGVAMLIFVFGYAPNFLLDRTTFLYYFMLATPYLALMAGGGLAMLMGRARKVEPVVDVEERPVIVGHPLYTTEGPVEEGLLFSAGTPADLEREEPGWAETAAEAEAWDVPPMAGPVQEAPAGRPAEYAPPGEPPWMLTLFWRSAWPERIGVILFLAAAFGLFWYWRPLFTGDLYVREVVEEAWHLVPWLERLLGPP